LIGGNKMGNKANEFIKVALEKGKEVKKRFYARQLGEWK